MTRDEFIDSYMKRSGIPQERRTPNGFSVTNHPGRVALRCACGQDECEGWAMVRDEQEDIDTHRELYAPRCED